MPAEDNLPRELLAHLRAAVRRAGQAEQTPVSSPMLAVVAGPLRICLGTHTVTLVGTALTLTRTEFDLLHTLVRANGRVKTRDELVEELRGRDWKLCGRAIVMHIFSLRKRLGADAKATRFIRTARGVAYMLVA